MRRYFLEVAYQGTRYHGWQIQQNARSVQEEIQNALSTLLRCSIATMGSGRTDTGVHALQQFLHFDYGGEIVGGDFIKRINAILPHDIAVLDLRKVVPEAHARFDALARKYEYHMVARKDPFSKNLAWHCFYELDVEAMDKAAALLMEYRDFECFSKMKTEVNHFHCEIKEAFWEQNEGRMIFHIMANRFLRGMVRAVVGTLVEIGRGKMEVEGIREVIESRSRSKAGPSVPPDGLYLSQVIYPQRIFV
ncbi:tRNA pseudouridine(38-40) synthase TruA [Negadavirga shengliensis]|uniref:tRNA pseudouridine synthase A n=1 Tax=Negadavirga shengliensis TaxID=1389218 RepID=A0ABV9T366_9BACT